MLIIMMALIGAVALIVVGLRRDKISLLILALCGSFISMLAGIVIYTAKIGGFSRNQQILLFLLPNIQQYLQYLPITLDVQGYAAAVGRCCFPCVLLLIALNYSMSTLVRRHIRKLRVLVYFVEKQFFIRASLDDIIHSSSPHRRVDHLIRVMGRQKYNLCLRLFIPYLFGRLNSGSQILHLYIHQNQIKFHLPRQLYNLFFSAGTACCLHVLLRIKEFTEVFTKEVKILCDQNSYFPFHGFHLSFLYLPFRSLAA